jgi:hypothetical protein
MVRSKIDEPTSEPGVLADSDIEAISVEEYSAVVEENIALKQYIADLYKNSTIAALISEETIKKY